MVMLRSNRTDIYNTVKKWSLGQERPIVTQVVMRDTAKQICNMLEYSFSVITQINCKLGGALWALDKTVDNTLVIGESQLLVYRRQVREDGDSFVWSRYEKEAFIPGLSTYTAADGGDVLGFVSSRNKLFTQWYSYAIMDRDAELREQLCIAIKKYSNVSPSASDQELRL